MDNKKFQEMLSKVTPENVQSAVAGLTPPQTSEAAAAPTSPSGDPSAATSVTPPAQPGAAPAPGAPPATRPDGTSFDQPPAQEPALGDPSGTDALAGGGLKGVFETKDFLFGDTPPEKQSEFRQSVEKTVALRSQQSIVDGFAAGIGQFAIGMIGLGKVEWAGDAVMAIPKLGKAAQWVYEAGKAASVGAIAFDPYQERLSNMIQGTWAANPVNAFLAADPKDGEAEARMKSAMESIGLDATLLGVFTIAGKVLQRVRGGDKAGAKAAAEELQKLTQEAPQDVQPPAGVATDTTAAAPQGGQPVAPSGAASPEQSLLPSASGSEQAPATGAAQPEAAPAVAGDVPPAVTAVPEPTTGAGPQDATIAAKVTDSPTAATAAADTTLPKPQPRIRLSDEDTNAVLDGIASDAKALADNGGSFDAAIQNGHTFGQGPGIPYAKMHTDVEVENFMARVQDVSQEKFDKLKGGAILTDKRVTDLIDQRATLYGDEPAVVIGMIQQAGKEASTMVANMEAGYLLSTKMFTDAFGLAQRINLGDFVEFGSKDLALTELKRRMGIASSVFASSRSITANAGRAVRRMRGEFHVDPEMVAAMSEMDADHLLQLVTTTKGNPRKMATLLQPGFLGKVRDWGQFLLVNNLVSGPVTQIRNILGNGFMLGVRPLERMIGAVVPAAGGNQASRLILKTAMKQYSYTASALMDSFKLAGQSFLQNESILSPRRTELATAGKSVQAVADEGFKAWDSIPNVLHNVLQVAVPNTIGLPTRTLGTVDELVKQTVYRSKVMAEAHWEGVEKATQLGLKDDAAVKFVQQHVDDAVSNAFDVEGRGTNAAALKEAQIATSQQDLLGAYVTPDGRARRATFGKTLSSIVANHPNLKFILPFVKTPANVIRMGWKLTPGLNLAQNEYRDMLMGRFGREAQHQATGQMAMGALFMGSAAVLVANGKVTGAGPTDPKTLAELKATGWQPYSYVVQHSDGTKTFVPWGKYDPFAIPFGIVADLHDAYHTLFEGEDDTAMQDKLEPAIGALGMAMAKQFANKSYLVSINSVLDAITSQDDKKITNVGGQMISNFIPYSAAMRQLNPDPHVREARDVMDKILATIPGLSDKVEARYDWAGDPVSTRKGLWTSGNDSKVDAEVQRLALEGGSTLTRVSPSADNGVDLREVNMVDGTNAYTAYQKLAGHLPGAESLKSIVGKVMATKAYKRAPDGDVASKGTKLWILHAYTEKYRSKAMKMLKADPNVRAALGQRDLKVREAYMKQQQADQAAKKPTLDQLGKAFGVDLAPAQQ